MSKIRRAKREFNRVFGFLQGKNIIEEYVKLKLGISKLTATEKQLLIRYIAIRKNNDGKFNNLVIEADKIVNNKLTELEQNE